MRHWRILCLLVLSVGWRANGALAIDQSVGYPNRPVRLIVPYPPGASVDFTAREVASKLSQMWGQSVVIDNRSGAGSTLGHGMGAKAPADGYTLLLGTSAGLVVSPALGVKLSYDPLKDFACVGQAVSAPFGLTLHTSVAAKTVKEFIELAKLNPHKYNYGSPGNGTPNHLGGELLKALAGIDIVHVPYKGGGPALTDLLSGQLQLMFAGLPQTLPHVKGGRLKMLAVGHPTRTRAAPDYPTVAETVPGFNNSTWYGLLAPAGTPFDIVHKINRDLNRAVSSEDFEARVLAQGIEPSGSTEQAMHEKIRTETLRWRKVMQAAGIAAESAL